MKNVYFLKTCNTCTRIINELNLSDDFKFQEIKSEPLTAKQVDELAKLAGSYEALFSKRAKLYKEMSLKDQNLTEKDFKQLILEEYTFLKRPVIIVNDEIFVGNSKKEIEKLLNKLNHEK